MTDKKQTEELNEAELENVQGGVYLPEFKKVRESAVKSKTGGDLPSSGDSSKIQEAKGFASSGSGSPTV